MGDDVLFLKTWPTLRPLKSKISSSGDITARLLRYTGGGCAAEAGFMVPGGLYYFKNGIRPNAAM